MNAWLRRASNTSLMPFALKRRDPEEQQPISDEDSG